MRLSWEMRLSVTGSTQTSCMRTVASGVLNSDATRAGSFPWNTPYSAQIRPVIFPFPRREKPPGREVSQPDGPLILCTQVLTSRTPGR